MKRIIAILTEDETYAGEQLSFLDADKYVPYIILMEPNAWTALLPDGTKAVVDKNDFSIFTDDTWVKFDFAYITSSAYAGSGKLQGYFDLLNIPYSSSNIFVSAITFNTFACNQYLKGFGVRVPESLVLKKGYEISADEIAGKIGIPCIVKTNEETESSAVTKVEAENKVWQAITNTLKYSNEVLIEAALQGTEVECACYKTKASEGVFLSVSLSDDLQKRIKALTSAIYDILGCSGMISAAYIIDKDNRISLLKINTVPRIMTDKGVMTDIIENKFL